MTLTVTRPTTVEWSAPFDALEPGQTFVTRGRTVAEADVVAFASLTGDWHPQHCDTEWAAESAFGERIAHGMLIVSFAAGLVPFDPRRVVALRRLDDVVFKRAVCLGETVCVHGKVADVRPHDNGSGLVSFAWTIVNQHGQRVCRARVEVLWSGDAPANSDDGFVRIGL